MNKPVQLPLEAAPSSLAPAKVAKRNNDAVDVTLQPKKEKPAQVDSAEEKLINPPADTGVYIDHRKNGGPLFQIPESELKHIDRIADDMRKEDEDEISPSEEFDWKSDESVLLKEQPATAVYINPQNRVVIRQEQGPLDDGDSFIFIAPENLERMIVELQHWHKELKP